jgi:hypothetical protein
MLFREKKRIMKTKFIIIALLLTLSGNIYSQNGVGTISGQVREANTKLPLVAANIILLGTDLGAATDANGNFLIRNVPSNTYQIRASIIGYRSQIKTDIIVQPGKVTQVDFELTAETIQLNNVVVRAEYFSRNILQPNSIKSFSYEEIRRSPGGFEDVVRALSILPGVAQADAGRNDLIVRGGAPSENLYVVDGLEIPNINHFGTQGATGGPLSYINLDFVRETSFSTGGFSVMYGDKLSSVLNIDLRQGRSDRVGGKATISATQFGLNLEGPALTENSNFIFSARRSYLDFIFKAAGFAFVPEYYDVLSKYDYKIDNKNSLSFLFIGAFDNVKFFNDTPEKRFDNSRILGSDQTQYATGLSYRRLFSNGFMNISLSRNFTDFNSIQSDTLLNPIFKNISREEENSLKLDVVHKFSPTVEMNFGVSSKFIEFDSDILFPFFVTSFGDTLSITSLNQSQNFFKGASYINFNFLFFNRLVTNVGIRFDYFDALNTKYYLSPRFSLSYPLTSITNLNFSTGIYHQTPSYIWLIADKSNRDLKSIKVNQYILGFDHQLNDDALLKVEGFIKDYSNYPTSKIRPYLVLANTGAGFSGSDDNFSSFGLEPLVSSGFGISRGVELSVQKKLSDTPYYGIFSFTYAKTDFTSLDGIKRDGAYDQNWIINLSGGYKISKHWEVSTKFRFASGRPYTPFQSNGTQLVADYNSRRLKSAHSLDLRVDRRWNFQGWSLITYLDIQNIYNQKNLSGIRWDRQKNQVDESSSIGILPSIGISAEF